MSSYCLSAFSASRFGLRGGRRWVRREKAKKSCTNTNRFNKQKRYVIFFLILFFFTISCKQRSLNSWCSQGSDGREGWAIAQRFDGQTFFFYAPKCRHQLQDAGGGAHPVFVLVVVVFVWLIDRLFQLSPSTVVDRKSYSRWSLSPRFLFVIFFSLLYSDPPATPNFHCVFARAPSPF